MIIISSVDDDDNNNNDDDSDGCDVDEDHKIGNIKTMTLLKKLLTFACDNSVQYTVQYFLSN